FVRRPKFAQFFLHPAFRAVAIVAVAAIVSLSVFVWQGSALAGGSSSLGALRHARARLRSALNLTPNHVAVAAVQGGIGSRTVISTIAGGGFGTNAPAKQAPMVMPTAVATDPLGRGFYVVAENSGTSLLRFVNTTNAPITIGGV